jgi:PAP2 superfamily
MLMLLRAMMVAMLMGGFAAPVQAAAPPDHAAMVLHQWYRLVLELVRHTPTYSPPVASRAFGYLGVTAFEVAAGGNPALVSLAGQLTGLTPPPARAPGLDYDEAAVMQAAMTVAVEAFFGNTGPTGQRAMATMTERMDARISDGVAPEVLARSRAQGEAVARHILDWSLSDGGAVVTNMGFPLEYSLTEGPAHWVPTSLIRQQQAPLLPGWGGNRPFALPDPAACALPPPTPYSEDPASAFYAEAMEVMTTVKTLTDEQKLIARFWSDDPMLSPTPPGHWISIAMQILEAEAAPADRRAEVLARLGITLADAFIGNWQTKYQYDLLRPVTYVRRLIDPKWEPLLITPPFPEYPSGHSTQSGAAAEVLTAIYGSGFAFSDATHEDDGLPARAFPDFRAAAEEAALSRLYGGIHFRPAIERGIDQGRCIGGFATALRMRT